jgi:hypothetical protein
MRSDFTPGINGYVLTIQRWEGNTQTAVTLQADNNNDPNPGGWPPRYDGWASGLFPIFVNWQDGDAANATFLNSSGAGWVVYWEPGRVDVALSLQGAPSGEIVTVMYDRNNIPTYNFGTFARIAENERINIGEQVQFMTDEVIVNGGQVTATAFATMWDLFFPPRDFATDPLPTFGGIARGVDALPPPPPNNPPSPTNLRGILGVINIDDMDIAQVTTAMHSAANAYITNATNATHPTSLRYRLLDASGVAYNVVSPYGAGAAAAIGTVTIVGGNYRVPVTITHGGLPIGTWNIDILAPTYTVDTTDTANAIGVNVEIDDIDDQIAGATVTVTVDLDGLVIGTATHVGDITVTLAGTPGIIGDAGVRTRKINVTVGDVIAESVTFTFTMPAADVTLTVTAVGALVAPPAP